MSIQAHRLGFFIFFYKIVSTTKPRIHSGLKCINGMKISIKKETNGVLEDYQLAPLDRKRLFNGMEDLITGGGRKKFVGVLSQLKQSYENGEY